MMRYKVNFTVEYCRFEFKDFLLSSCRSKTKEPNLPFFLILAVELKN